MLGGANAVLRLVQQRDGLLVRAVGLPGDIRGGVARARGEDELVVGQRARGGAPAGLGRDRLGGEVDSRGGADDQLNALLRVAAQGRLERPKDLLVLETARDDGSNRGDVPVKVTVLSGRLVRELKARVPT